MWNMSLPVYSNSVLFRHWIFLFPMPTYFFYFLFLLLLFFLINNSNRITAKINHFKNRPIPDMAHCHHYHYWLQKMSNIILFSPAFVAQDDQWGWDFNCSFVYLFFQLFLNMREIVLSLAAGRKSQGENKDKNKCKEKDWLLKCAALVASWLDCNLDMQFGETERERERERQRGLWILICQSIKVRARKGFIPQLHIKV